MEREYVLKRVRRTLEEVAGSEIRDFADGDHILRSRLLDSAGFLGFLVGLELEFDCDVLDHPRFSPERLTTIEAVTEWLTRHADDT